MTVLGRLRACVLLVALGLAAGGCSGINNSASWSPLDLLLPGLLKTTPRETKPELVPVSPEVAVVVPSPSAQP